MKCKIDVGKFVIWQFLNRAIVIQGREKNIYVYFENHIVVWGKWLGSSTTYHMLYLNIFLGIYNANNNDKMT